MKLKPLADRFRAMGFAADGIVEAIYMPDRKVVWGVQWHPEFSYRVNEDSRKIFAAFLQAAGEA